MLCSVRTRQPQGVDLILREKVDSVVCWFCFGLCVRAWPLHSEQEKDVKFWKGKMTVPANATQARSSPKAEAFRFISMALVKIWLSLEVWEWTFTKSCPAAKQKQCAGWNSRFMFFEHQLWRFFLFWLLLPSPSWTRIPTGFSWGCRILQSNPWWKNRDPSWQAQGVSLWPPQAFRGTSRKKRKEEWTGQAGCRHIIKDSPSWRVNSLCGSQDWVIHPSQNEMLILSAPDLQQFIAARAPAWQDQFKAAGPEHSAVAAEMGLSMSHVGGWINEQGWSWQLLSLLITMNISVQPLVNGSMEMGIISKTYSRSWK